MTTERAFSRIDRAVAVLGNRFLEREWTEFTGTTMSLAHKAGGTEWIAGPCKELSLVRDGSPMGLMDFSVVDIDETSGPHGASLMMRRGAPGIGVRTEISVLHDLPALVRRSTLLNLTEDEMTVDRFAEEVLTMRPGGWQLRHDGFGASMVQGRIDCEERAVALAGPDHGWLVGREGGAVFDLCESAPETFRIEARESIALGPGEVRVLPRVYWIAYAGSLETAAQKLMAEVLLAMRAQDKEERVRAAEPGLDG